MTIYKFGYIYDFSKNVTIHLIIKLWWKGLLVSPPQDLKTFHWYKRMPSGWELIEINNQRKRRSLQYEISTPSLLLHLPFHPWQLRNFYGSFPLLLQHHHLTKFQLLFQPQYPLFISLLQFFSKILPQIFRPPSLCPLPVPWRSKRHCLPPVRCHSHLQFLSTILPS